MKLLYGLRGRRRSFKCAALTFLLTAVSSTAQTLPCGFNVAGTLSVAGEQDNFSVTGVTQGDVITVRMNDATESLEPVLQIFNGAGNLIASDTGSADEAAAVDVTLSSPGPYTIRASDSQNDETGDYGIFLQRFNSPCSATGLASGDNLAGAFASTYEYDTYELSGVAPGDTITVRMNEVSGSFEPVLQIFDAQGALLDSDVASRNASVDVTLSSPGPYTVLAYDYEHDAMGGYGIFLQRLNNPGGAVPVGCGVSLGGTLASVHEYDTFTLSGAAPGQRILLRMSEISGLIDPVLQLFNGQGALVDSESGSSSTPATLNLVLPASGPYTVLAYDSSHNEAGDYGMFLQRLDVPCAPALSLGQSMPGTISTLHRIDSYRLLGVEGGQSVTLCATGSTGTLDPFLELFDGMGASGRADDDRLPFTVPATAPYLALVRDNAMNGTGNYTLSLRAGVSGCAGSDTAPPSVTVLAPVAGELVTAGLSYQIRWTAADDVAVASQEIRLSTDGGSTFPTVIASNLPGTAQSYWWSIPAALRSTSARIRVIARDATGASGQGEMSGDFFLVDHPPVRTITYSYDDLDRLVEVRYSNGATLTYGYDAAGNRTGETGVSAPPADSPLSYYTLVPCRILDTRLADGPFGGPVLRSGVVRLFDVGGRCGIPQTAQAISVIVTAVSPSDLGYVTLFSGDGLPPTTSTLNFTAGRTVANNAILQLSREIQGKAAVRPFIGGSGTVHLVIDVNGYFDLE